MSEQTIRWIQRLENFKRAKKRLDEAVILAKERELSNLEKQGMIQAFEFVFELAWIVMKDYFQYQGNPNITGSRDAIRGSFKTGLILDGEGWMQMIKSRNLTSHTYDEALANEICDEIQNKYHHLFTDFADKMQSLIKQNS